MVQVQTGATRARPKSRVVLSLVLVLLLVAALAPLSPARATDHMPWDQPGSQWQGTVGYSYRASYFIEQHPQRLVDTGSATYTDLLPVDAVSGPLNATADGNYASAITTSGGTENWSHCGTFQAWEKYRFSASAPLGQSVCEGCGEYPSRFSLLTDDSGKTTFYLGGAYIPFNGMYTGECGATGPFAGIGPNGFPISGPQGAQNGLLLTDQDPDPLHLVGQTVEPFPGDTADTVVEDYEFTVTYDLRLVGPCDGVSRSDVVGRQPSYVSLDKKLSSFPNRAAACSGMWAPHLDAGFIPQGIAPAGDHMWVAGYFKTHKDDKPVECAVYLMDPKTGRRGLGYVFTKEHLNWASVAAGFDTPRKCGHAGGLSVLPDGRVLVADTSSLFVLNPAAFGNANPIEQVIKLVDPNDGAFNGSFLVDGISSSDPNLATIWIGTFDKGYAGRLREVTVAEILDDNIVSAGDASPDPILLPVKSQGGAFAANGDLWIASSTSGCGMVTRFDAATGEHESFGFGPGAEEISFVGDRLWGAFEAGTRLYQKKFFPLIASFDPSKIVENRSALSPYCLGLLPLPF